MISLSRYRGPAAVVLGLLAAIVLVDVGLTATIGFAGRYLPNGESPTDDMVFRATWAKVVQVFAPTEGTAAGGTPAPYGVMFGQSPLGAGVDAALLEEADGLPIHWYNLHGWGGSLNATRDLAELAYASDMKPDVVLICVAPYMLVGHPFEKEHREIMRREGKLLKPWIWTYDNRHVVNHMARRIWMRTRLWLLKTFDFGFLTLYPPAEDQRKTRRARLPSLSPDRMAARVEEYRPLGWYDARSYSVDSSNGRSLVEIVRMSRDRGAKVAVILLPEYSLFRKRIPPEGVRCFDDINRAYFPDDPVPIYNLRDRLSDDLFLDPDHASVDGMGPISTMVGECVHDFLTRQPGAAKGRGGDGLPQPSGRFVPDAGRGETAGKR